MGMAQKVQANPGITMISTLAAVALAGSAIWSGIGMVDEIIMTQAEAAEIHAAYDRALTEVNQQVVHEAKLGQCRYLSDRIDRLEYEIYVLQRDQASPDFIQSKQQALARERRKFTALLCAGLI